MKQEMKEYLEKEVMGDLESNIVIYYKEDPINFDTKSVYAWERSSIFMHNYYFKELIENKTGKEEMEIFNLLFLEAFNRATDKINILIRESKSKRV